MDSNSDLWVYACHEVPDRYTCKNAADLIVEDTEESDKQTELGMLLTMAQGFEKGVCVPQNSDMAVSLYTQAAKKGSMESAYRLAEFYRDGKFVAKDIKTALTYFRQAAEALYKDAAQLDTCLANECADLMTIINRRESYDRQNAEEMLAFRACFSDYNEVMHRHWALRDSLTNLYDATDPLREQFWQIWVNRETKMHNELMPILQSKLRD